ncbi:uncharacterized protein METZ01_LOCUS346895 [marine metagenome]|uniref:Uncharacterized protein n=1 Tax=marine metagenome TaxID=408172 RepID=A0A382RBV2_9ZZZZ
MWAAVVTRLKTPPLQAMMGLLR